MILKSLNELDKEAHQDHDKPRDSMNVYRDTYRLLINKVFTLAARFELKTWWVIS